MINRFKNIYFLGIGGIGMSALAAYFSKEGKAVAGYDLVRNSNCISLEKIGINIHYNDDINLIPEKFLNPDDSLIVYTPAIPKNHSELNYFIKNNYQILKRAQVLGELSKYKNTIAVAGTHGKTSVSTMAAWIISQSEKSCTAFLGGISKNIDSNLFIDNAADILVVEADEYDRSFLNFAPNISLITQIEEDHLDIYKNFNNLLQAFIEYINNTKPKGSLIVNEKVADLIKKEVPDNIDFSVYGMNNKHSNFYIKDLKYENDYSCFDFVYDNRIIPNLRISTGGTHNLENTIGAIALAIKAGVSDEEIRSSLRAYQGVKRRFETIIKTKNTIYIDDYAHHPEEINATLQAVKSIYPDKKITGIFQPHLFSRTKDFAKEFAKALSNLDELILLPIYPAREEPIKGVSSNLIYDLCSLKNKKLIDRADLLDYVKKQKFELLITMGAGDIDRLVNPIKNIIKINEN